MPKYIVKIFTKMLATITPREMELLAAWVKNTDSQVVQYHIGSLLEQETDSPSKAAMEERAREVERRLSQMFDEHGPMSGQEDVE